jgi:Iron-containing redox enzyme
MTNISAIARPSLDQITSKLVQREVEAHEESLLEALDVKNRLTAVFEKPGGLKRFAEAFYFCRVGFVKHNFILGTRCWENEKLWVGLGRNLWEEAGGDSGEPHNMLYRNFLISTGASDPTQLREPDFAKIFDTAWDRECRDAPILSALMSFAVYEAMDAPDYRMMFEVLSPFCGNHTLKFFKVHVEARHVELFDDALELCSGKHASETYVRSFNFVSSIQKEMWIGLLNHLER